jgi:hypothetical protein
MVFVVLGSERRVRGKGREVRSVGVGLLEKEEGKTWFDL